ncbi:hypothetical protein Q3G72_018282 [Acer saccharum]|nr:hypothetical protein Q3G72_018282 [Acer saccharum]
MEEASGLFEIPSKSSKQLALAKDSRRIHDGIAIGFASKSSICFLASSILASSTSGGAGFFRDWKSPRETRQRNPDQNLLAFDSGEQPHPVVLASDGSKPVIRTVLLLELDETSGPIVTHLD